MQLLKPELRKLSNIFIALAKQPNTTAAASLTTFSKWTDCCSCELQSESQIAIFPVSTGGIKGPSQSWMTESAVKMLDGRDLFLQTIIVKKFTEKYIHTKRSREDAQVVTHHCSWKVLIMSEWLFCFSFTSVGKSIVASNKSPLFTINITKVDTVCVILVTHKAIMT